MERRADRVSSDYGYTITCNDALCFELTDVNPIFLFCSYGYSKERFVWSLISAVGIFCLGSGATIVHGVQNLWNSHVRTPNCHES